MRGWIGPALMVWVTGASIATAQAPSAPTVPGSPRPVPANLPPAASAALELSGSTEVPPCPTPTGPISPELPPAVSAALELSSPTEPAAPESEPAAKPFDGDPFWKKVPVVHPLPPTGSYPIGLARPGAFSAKDWFLGIERQSPPKYAYPSFGLIQPPFFDISFAYLEDPNLPEIERDPLDFLKRVHLGDNFLFSTGGQTWTRHMGEVNRRLTGLDNNYNLWRARVYGDLWYRDLVRVYTEFLSAQTFNQDQPPLVVDRDYADLLNAFVEVKLFEVADKGVHVRVGRQELLLGSQRLISTLDWANTRRTFQGVRAFRVGEKWDFDLFWVQPVIPNAQRFDSVDNNVNFAGAWLTYRPKKGTFRDAYYLVVDNTSHITERGIVHAPYNVHTLGTRAVGNENGFLYDVELMLQLGARGSSSIIAGATHIGGGRDFKDLPLKPVAWLCYDYASGDNSPNSGSYTTFNQLFPFSHFYLGWLDLVGRQNIHDINAHLVLYPSNWITVWGQYHHFQLAARRDALYAANGVALRRDPTGRAGSNVGDEIDLVLNFHLSHHLDLLFGYSHLFAGGFLQRTAANANQAMSPDLWYAMYSYRW